MQTSSMTPTIFPLSIHDNMEEAAAVPCITPSVFNKSQLSPLLSTKKFPANMSMCLSAVEGAGAGDMTTLGVDVPNGADHCYDHHREVISYCDRDTSDIYGTMDKPSPAVLPPSLSPTLSVGSMCLHEKSVSRRNYTQSLPIMDTDKEDITSTASRRLDVTLEEEADTNAAGNSVSPQARASFDKCTSIDRCMVLSNASRYSSHSSHNNHNVHNPLYPLSLPLYSPQYGSRSDIPRPAADSSKTMKRCDGQTQLSNILNNTTETIVDNTNHIIGVSEISSPTIVSPLLDNQKEDPSLNLKKSYPFSLSHASGNIISTQFTNAHGQIMYTTSATVSLAHGKEQHDEKETANIWTRRLCLDENTVPNIKSIVNMAERKGNKDLSARGEEKIDESDENDHCCPCAKVNRDIHLDEKLPISTEVTYKEIEDGYDAFVPQQDLSGASLFFSNFSGTPRTVSFCPPWRDQYKHTVVGVTDFTLPTIYSSVSNDPLLLPQSPASSPLTDHNAINLHQPNNYDICCVTPRNRSPLRSNSKHMDDICRAPVKNYMHQDKNQYLHEIRRTAVTRVRRRLDFTNIPVPQLEEDGDDDVPVYNINNTNISKDDNKEDGISDDEDSDGDDLSVVKDDDANITTHLNMKFNNPSEYYTQPSSDISLITDTSPVTGRQAYSNNLLSSFSGFTDAHGQMLFLRGVPNTDEYILKERD